MAVVVKFATKPKAKEQLMLMMMMMVLLVLTVPPLVQFILFDLIENCKILGWIRPS